MSEIAILVPVLGRPDRAQPLVNSIRRSSLEARRIVFICSPHDRRQIRACNATDADDVLIADWDAGPGDFARKMNFGFWQTKELFVLAAADDLTFELGWDTAALLVADETGAGVIGTWDGANPKVKVGKHATHPLVRRSYAESPTCTYDQSAPIYHEGYDHQCVDNELVEAAMIRGQWAFSRDSHVLHHHPIFDRRVAMDDTYRKGLARGQDDRALFMRRSREFRRRERAAQLAGHH